MTSRPILFNDFRSEYAELKREISAGFKRVFDSGYFLLSQETLLFEQEFSAALGQSFTVAVANGTEALAIALMVSGVQPGDEVIVPALTAYPTVIAVEMARAVPVVCDVSLETGLMDPESFEKVITKKTRAVVPVHLYGQMCPMKKIAAIAKAHNIVIVEDCAQSVFASQDGKMAGSWSRAAAFSFYPSKNLAAYGDAGAIATNDPQVAEHAQRLRQYGQSTRYVHEEFGFNSRMDELQASILRVKLPRGTAWIERRREIAAYYLEHLQFGQPLSVPKGNFHRYHLFVTRVPEREKVMSACDAKGLPTIIHYPCTVYQQPAFLQGEGRAIACPNAETLVKEIVSLPIHPYLSDRQVKKVCKIWNGLTLA